MRTLAGTQDFHGQPWISDTPANKRCIEDQGFYKSVPGSWDYLVFVWLCYAAGRISSAVYGEAGFVPVYKEAGYAGEKLG